jgi:hypothetical protein
MARRVELSSTAGTPTWEDITDLVYLETARWGGTADHGLIDTGSGFDLRDDPGTRATLPWRRRVRLVEEATTPDTVMWQGRTVADELSRGIIRTGDAKLLDVSLVDVNADFGGIGFASTHRPAETDVQRVQYFLDRYMSGQSRASFVVADTYFSSANPVNLPAFSYTSHQLIDVFNHIVETSGKQFFITKDYELFYDLPTSTAYPAGLSISDTGYDFSTVFPPGNPTAFENATEFYSGTRFRYSGGRTTQVIRSALQTANDAWRTQITDESVTTEAAALAKANVFLDEHQYAHTTYSCTLDLPATKVDLIAHGMTVSCRAAAWGLLSPVTLRVGRLSWELINDTTWRAHLELGVPGKMKPSAAGGGGAGVSTPPTTPYVPADNPPDIVLEFCNTVMEDSGREGSQVTTTPIVTGVSHFYRITTTQHSATAITDDFVLYGLGQVAGAIPDGDAEGTFTPVIGGFYGAEGSADYSGAATVDECWKVEIWIDATGVTANTPSPGQIVVESFTGDGVTTDFQTNYPYIENSLEVYVGGVAVIPTQTDPAAGEFTLPFAPANGTDVVLRYLAASFDATSAGNDPTPPSVTPVIPVTLDWGEDADITTLDYDDVADSGALAEVARADHRHGMPSASGGSLTVADEGSNLTTAATTLDFVGAGVTASGSGATKTITIPGGGGSILYPLDDITLHSTHGDHFDAATLDTGLWTRRSLDAPSETLSDSWLHITNREGTNFGYTQSWTPQTEAEFQMASSHFINGDEGFGIVVLNSSGTGVWCGWRTTTNLGIGPVTTYSIAGTFGQGYGFNGQPYMGTGQKVWSSVVKKGSWYFFRFSWDGATWTTPMTAYTPSAFTPSQIGFMSGHQDATGGHRNIRVDWFNVAGEWTLGNNLMITPSSGTVTATAGGTNFSGTPGAVIDGDTTTAGWIQTNATAVWWNAAFSVNQTMNRLRLYGYDHDWGSGYVEFSSGTKIPFYANNGTYKDLYLDFPSETTSFVKVWAHMNGNGSFLGWREIEAYLATAV